MSELVKIQISLKEGNVLVEAPSDALELVFNKLESFLPRLVQTSEGIHQEVSSQKEHNEEVEEVEEVSNRSEEKPAEIKSNKRKKTSGSKTESYKVVEIGLNHDQRAQYKAFFEEKKPINQNQQVLIAMYWLVKEANKPMLSKDEIFTGLRTVNSKIPARISSVLSNLMIEGKVNSEGGKYGLTHIGEDYVSYDLPAKKNPA